MRFKWSLGGVVSRRCVQPINPALAEFRYPISVQSCCSGAQLASWVLAKIFNGYVTQVYLGEFHRLSVHRWLCFAVDLINENTHPLVSSSVRINGPACLSRCLYFHTISAGLNAVFGVKSLHNQVRVPVEVLILNQRP